MWVIRTAQEQLSGITITSSLRLELKSFKRFEICILTDYGYVTKFKPKTFAARNEFTIIENHINDEVQHLIEFGWVFPKPKGESYCLTVKGIMLMTWTLCWPIKMFVSKVDISRSEKALRVGNIKLI